MSKSHKYLSHIRQAGYRVTPQRQFILEVIENCGGHATVNEIYDQVRAKMPTLNRATVYRTLDFLCNLRLVAKTDIGGRSMYEMIDEDRHHHLICRHCEQVQMLDDHHFHSLSHHLLAEHGFKAEFDHIAISGICAACQKKLKEE